MSMVASQIQYSTKRKTTQDLILNATIKVYSVKI